MITDIFACYNSPEEKEQQALMQKELAKNYVFKKHPCDDCLVYPCCRVGCDSFLEYLVFLLNLENGKDIENYVQNKKGQEILKTLHYHNKHTTTMIVRRLPPFIFDLYLVNDYSLSKLRFKSIYEIDHTVDKLRLEFENNLCKREDLK